MPQVLSDEGDRRFIGELRKGVARVFERIGCEREQSLHFRGNVDPSAQRGAPAAAPSFGGQANLERIEEGKFSEVRQQAMSRIHPVNDTRQSPNHCRRGYGARLEWRTEFLRR